MSSNSQLATLDNKTTLTLLRMFLGLTQCTSQLNSKVCTVFAKLTVLQLAKKIPLISFLNPKSFRSHYSYYLKFT